MQLCSSAFLLLLVASAYGQDNLDIRLPPTITKQNTELVVAVPEDTPVLLVCEANGEPAPEYEWKFKDEILDLNNANIKTFEGVGTIEVKLGPLQEGSYQCFAKNQYGTTMTDISYILRAVLAAFPPVEDKDYFAQEGDSLVVQCLSTKSIPEPQYSWETIETRETGDARQINLDRRIQQDNKGNLYFAHVTMSDHQDGRLYQCVTKNPNYGGSRFGSYSKVEIGRGTVPDSTPTNLFYTGRETSSSVIAIKGRVLKLQCLFSGLPVPTVTWKKKNGALPNDRISYENFDTTLIISNVQDVDEGVYTCTGRNSQGNSNQDVDVEVESVPEFLSGDDMPKNLNVTQGKDAMFRCATVAEPGADIQWYINGQMVTEVNKPERVFFEDDSRTLKIQDTCKDCPEPPSDLKVYQCNASNIHGYQFAAGYLNVLLPTTLVQPPQDVQMVYGDDVRFECRGSSDDSTPIAITWLKDRERVITAKPGRISFEEDNSILVIDEDELHEEGVEGDYTCVITNGYSTVNETASLTRPAGPIPVTGASVGSYWWIFLIIGLLLLLLLLLLICCLCCQRNRGDSYPVDEKERANGNDPEKELVEGGFHDYQRPEDEPIKGSRASLSSAMRLESDDDESLAEYGDIDTGRFNEDGSFIGQYNTGDRRGRGDTKV